METSNKKQLINFAIMMVLTIGIGFLPPFGVITPMGMKVLGVFVGMLYGWICVDFLIPSWLGMIALGLTGYMTIQQVFMAAFGDGTVVQMAFSFFLVAMMNQLDVTDVIANWVLTRKFSKGHPWLVVTTICLAGFAVGCIAAIPAILLLWSVCYKIADKVGYEKRSKEMAYLLCGVLIIAGNSGYLFPFRAGAIMYGGTLTQGTGIAIPAVQWYFAIIVSNILFMILFILMGKLMKVNVAPLAREDLFDDLEVTCTVKQKWGLVFNLFIILFLLLPDFFPKNTIVNAWKSFTVIGATILVYTAGYFITDKGKKLIPDPVKTAKQGMMWDMFFMIGATLPLGAAMRSDEAGIINTMVPAVINMMGDHSWIMFTIISAIVLGLVTQVSHNMIITLVMFPVLSKIVMDMGGDPTLWFFVNFLAVMAAYTTPAVSVYGALYHGNSEWITPKYGYLFGFSGLVIAWLGGFALIPIWVLIF